MRRTTAVLIASLIIDVATAYAVSGRAGSISAGPDPVVVRIQKHAGADPPGTIRVVSADDFPRALWQRVKNLVAFRIHRHADDGTTTADPAIYLVGSSQLYLKAAAALRTGATHHEYVWCLLAAVITHETAHTGPNTERQALEAEVKQLRECMLKSHLFATDGWNSLAYLGAVEAKLRNPREHY
jgi:hypothetical protein